MPYTKAQAREALQELLDSGLHAEGLANMVSGWMTGDDLMDMLTTNGFFDEIEEDEESEEREPIDLEDDVDPQGA